MPKGPVLHRTLLYTRNPDKTVRLLDFCAVDTELGPMVEHRAIVGNAAGALLQGDAFDMLAYDDIRETNEDAAYREYGTYFQQQPVEFNR